MTSLSLPIWSKHSEVDDQFVGVIAGAPSFEFLNSCVTYEVTLDMAFSSLSQGVKNVSRRVKDGAKAVLYIETLGQLEIARTSYARGDNSQGKTALMEAHNVFRKAARRNPLWSIERLRNA